MFYPFTHQDEGKLFYPLQTLPHSVQPHFQSNDYPDIWGRSVGFALAGLYQLDLASVASDAISEWLLGSVQG